MTAAITTAILLLAGLFVAVVAGLFIAPHLAKTKHAQEAIRKLIALVLFVGFALLVIRLRHGGA